MSRYPIFRQTQWNACNVRLPRTAIFSYFSRNLSRALEGYCPCFHSLHSYWKSKSSKLFPFGPHEVSVLIELTLGHLRYHWTDVPPQPNSPPDYVFRANQMHSQLYKCLFLVKWLYTFGYGSNLSTSSSGWLSPRLLQFGGFIDTIWYIIRYITIHHNTISLPFLNIQTQRLRRNWDGASFGSQVDSSALGMLRTELHVLPVSPVQLFRNLYIDFSWYPLQGEGRHLQESCGDLSWKITGQIWGLQ